VQSKESETLFQTLFLFTRFELKATIPV